MKFLMCSTSVNFTLMLNKAPFFYAECAPRCTGRCSKTSFKKPCMFFCQKCCAKCLCVPPGTYGNKQVCPCYNNWKTKSGGPKCP
ncbi:Hypothetical predicted protein [Olea europaea subsp. europaea]|uniref:Uncharacterized protein n=1 Tax=Olea europaea subsp. europaea TaxID=158383 RepID=A0A8S0SIX7_OLEEU|nr:Hypothetical predicted protein [Olea europaea subsp. europaea]